MGNKYKNVNQEGEEADKEIDQGEDEEHEQIPRRVGWGMQMGHHSHDKHDECEECGDGVDYQNRRKCVSHAAGQVKGLRALRAKFSCLGISISLQQARPISIGPYYTPVSYPIPILVQPSSGEQNPKTP